MNSSQPNPALPTWIFIATDLALISAAAAIAVWSPHPLATSAMLWIVACVGIGAIVGLVPLVARYERQKNEALDERQHALEALARTVAASAEQISIAANGIHQIADLAHKNLRSAEQLPHKLQEKIAEFQAQLAVTADTEKEELERELLALRTSESERLDSVSQRIAKSTADWTKLEAATHQHLTAASEAVSKLAFGTAGAIGKAQAAAEQALAQARIEAARSLGEVSGNAARNIETAKASALAELDARLAAATTTFVHRVRAELTAIVAASLPAAPKHSPAAQATDVSETPPSAANGIPHAENPAAVTPSATDASGAAPKRARKPRRDESATDHVVSAPVDPSPANHAAKAAPAEPPPVVPEEPLPVPAHTIPEITPVAPATAEPFSGHIVSSGSSSPVPTESASPLPEPVGVPVKSAATGHEPDPGDGLTPAKRKRGARKAEGQDDPGLGLELDEAPGAVATATNERVLTSDGATRLLVTAYIGIGNRLFIRGEGPGLSWEKGVPLQFVSIGKWRWESSEADAPVQFRLYKNDDLECSALGMQSLDPGHQQEVTAAF